MDEWMNENKELGYGEAEFLGQSHTASKWQSPDLTSSLDDSKILYFLYYCLPKQQRWVQFGKMGLGAGC